MDAFKKLSSEMKLWDWYPAAGKALPHWLPNGAIIRNAIEEFWKQEHAKKDYQLVYTPHIGVGELWETSGHTERFSGKMYPPLSIDPYETYYLRPMNCPFHILLYKSEARTYKQLPLRYAELGTVYRKVPSGSFEQMFEVRGFTQDDAHIFCEPHRAQKEIAKVIEFAVFFLKDVFRITESDYRIIRRLKPPGGLGDDEHWDKAHKILEDVLNDKDISYEDKPGEGVFYGPKIDFEIMDPYYNKPWVFSTIQLDIVLADRFGVEYFNERNERQTPMIIHRTILGSLERFVSLLLARSHGHFPVWLAPCQVAIVPVGHKETESWADNLRHANSIKTTLDKSLSDLNPRIRVHPENQDLREAKAEAIKIKPRYIVVLGEKERTSEKLAVTEWDGTSYTSETRFVSVDDFAGELRSNIQSKV